VLRWNEQAPGFGFTTGTPWFTPGSEAPGVSVEAQRARDGSLWSLYRDLIALRHAEPALALGDAVRPELDGGGRGTFALLRTHEGRRVLLVVNLDAQETGAFTVKAPGTPRALLDEGLLAPPAGDGSTLSFTGLAAQSFAVLALDGTEKP
jgi:glycosidase